MNLIQKVQVIRIAKWAWFYQLSLSADWERVETNDYRLSIRNRVKSRLAGIKRGQLVDVHIVLDADMTRLAAAANITQQAREALRLAEVAYVEAKDAAWRHGKPLSLKALQAAQADDAVRAAAKDPVMNAAVVNLSGQVGAMVERDRQEAKELK